MSATWSLNASTWIFSGIGTSVAMGIFGWLWNKRRREPQTINQTSAPSNSVISHDNLGVQIAVNQNTGVINQGMGSIEIHHHQGQTAASEHIFSFAEITNRIENSSVFEKHEVIASFSGARARFVGKLESIDPIKTDKTLWLVGWKDPVTFMGRAKMIIEAAQLDELRLRNYGAEQVFEIIGNLQSVNQFSILFEAKGICPTPLKLTF